jgi:hypothetical protein
MVCLDADLDSQLEALATEVGATKVGTVRTLVRDAANARGDTAFDKIWKAAQWSRDAATADVLTCAHNAGLSKTMAFSDVIRLLMAYEGAGRPLDTHKFVQEYKAGKPLTQGPPLRDPEATLRNAVVAGSSHAAEPRYAEPGCGFTFGVEAPTPEAIPAPVSTRPAGDMAAPSFVNGRPVFKAPAGLVPVNAGFSFETEQPNPGPSLADLEVE